MIRCSDAVLGTEGDALVCSISVEGQRLTRRRIWPFKNRRPHLQHSGWSLEFIMCSARCRLSKKYSSHNAQYTPSIRIISVDMMIDDNGWLVGSTVVVGCSKCCNCGDPGCRAPFYTIRWYAHVLTRLRHGLRGNKYPRLPVLHLRVERRHFWFHGSIVFDQFKRGYGP